MKRSLVLVFALYGCANPTPPEQVGGARPASAPDKPGTSAINAAGASFPYPLISKWTSIYHDQTGVKINYQSIGSGGGQKALLDRTVAFAGSDAPLSQDKWEQAQARGGVVHIPETLGAVVPVVHVEGVSGLKLTGAALADIYLGKVKKWNDPEIARLNPNAKLPAHDIVVVHRSDGSGTTFVFTGYLSKVSPDWKAKVGQNTAVSWPVGVGAKGNEGVAGVLTGNADTIGYVELAYAALNHLDTVVLQNKAGNWVSPTMKSVSAAAAGAVASLPAGSASWARVDITDAGRAEAWPISSFSYLLFYQDMAKAYGRKQSRDDAEAAVKFAWWAVHDGQRYGPALQYASLPPEVVRLDEATIRSITWNGQPLLKD